MPVEYERGVSGGVVLIPIEIQEAITFMGGAQAAFADLRLELETMDAPATLQLNETMNEVAAALQAANRQESVADPDTITAQVASLTENLTALFPAEWLANNADADFDVLAEVLDQMIAAAQQVGWLTFKLQKRLPYKTMLVWTGVLIGLVRVTMVGKTVHVMQAVGWLGITPIKGLVLPYWAGLWLGLFSTWQGIVAQFAAAAFVIGSYYLAEYWQARHRPTTSRPATVTQQQGAGD